jgi:predicted DNA-binding transcriptional regulator YafY
VEALRAMRVSPGWGGRALAADPETLVAVAQVCRDTERLEFDYTAAGGERTERHVEPLRLVSLGRRWYLVAYDLGRHDWRTFRLDRLRRPRGTGARFRPRELPAEDAAAFVRSGLKQVPASYTVRALVRAPADEVRTRIGQWATVSDAEDGQCLMTMNTDWLDWPAMALGTLGAEFTVLEPPALIDYLREWSQRFGRAAEG